ncbi:hypothetical protein ONZ45_g5382 [Pleurotus djamor]|nr:hypothetical protein ONZ45_g5382 [Pleurotus djamor]
MSHSSSNGAGYVLAGILFPFLFVTAIHHIVIESTFTSGLSSDLAAQCTQGSRFLHNFSKITVLDQYVCKLVALFHALLEPEPTLLLQSFSSAGVLSTFMAVEAHRRSHSILVAFPLTVTFLGQFFTFGLVNSVYWALFIWSGTASIASSFNSQITQADAEGIIFASIVGGTIPAIMFNAMMNPTVTALWQIFPVYAAIAQWVYTSIRKPSQHPQSGFKTIRGYYIFLFLFAASEHIRLFGFLNISLVSQTVLPSYAPLSTAASLASKVNQLLMWDFVYVFAPTILGTLWFARDIVEVAKLAAWHAIAVPLIGPGASLTAVFIWRETVLNGNEVGDKQKST